MSLKHVDFRVAMRRIADRRIEEAMAQGKFDNLPGKGKDIDLDRLPSLEEDERLTWLRLLSNKPSTGR
jgi:DnaJ-like protein